MTISRVEEANPQALVDKYNTFRTELASLINRYSMENTSDTPDFILAEYLTRCLETFDACTRRRELWYGRKCGDGTAIFDKPKTGEPTDENRMAT